MNVVGTESNKQLLFVDILSRVLRIIVHVVFGGLQNQMKMNKVVNNMIVGEEESAQLKAQIDGYIKEIDKCIAHLAE